MSGDALATLSLNGTIQDTMHVAHIHMNSAIEGGAIAVTFNPVTGVASGTAMSMTNISNLDAGAGGGAITYNEILDYDGYVNVHYSATNLMTIVSQGDIGGNELTGVTKTYALPEADVPGTSAVLLFEERKNGNALATITVTSTGPLTADAPAHIHKGSVADAPGDIAFSFTPIDMLTKMSVTHVEKLDGGDANSFGYADVLAYDGYVNVHQSSGNLGTLLAQGDIGSNE